MSPKPTKLQQQLIDYLFDKQISRTSNRVSAWILASKRYQAFAAEYKDKIRKKLRTTQPQALAELTSELHIPYLLLQEKRFDIAYEPFNAASGRGADFAVTYRKNFTFSLEITHIHNLHVTATQAGEAIDPHLVDVIAAKLSQLQANMANVLLVAVPEAAHPLEPSAHLTWMMARADQGDAAFDARYRFKNASGFFKLFERLSALALLSSQGSFVLGPNPRAKQDLPAQVLAALQRTLTTVN